MKTLHIVAYLVALFGAFLVALLPFEFLSVSLSSDKTMPSLILMASALCIGSGLFVIALTFIKKKDLKSAVNLAYGSGVAAWISTIAITRQYIHMESLISTFTTFGVTFLVGVAVFYSLARGIISRVR